MKVEIIGRDGVIRRISVNAKQNSFRVGNHSYIVRPRAILMRKDLFGLPRKTLIYIEGIPEPLEIGDKGFAANPLTAEELDAILSAKILHDIGKPGFSVSVKWIIVGVIAVAVLVAALKIFGVIH